MTVALCPIGSCAVPYRQWRREGLAKRRAALVKAFDFKSKQCLLGPSQRRPFGLIFGHQAFDKSGAGIGEVRRV